MKPKLVPTGWRNQRGTLMSDWIDTGSGPGAEVPRRERTTASVHALVTPATRTAFVLWAERRGMGVSAAVRALVEDALWREARGEPLGALYGDLPADVARRIVAESSAPETPREA